MNIPRFTAEASLYKTSGHYRAGRYTIVIDAPNPSIRIVKPSELLQQMDNFY